MNEKRTETPYTNRGVENTYKKAVKALYNSVLDCFCD